MATIRKRQTKNGVSYIIQVKMTDRGSGQQVVRSRVWKPEEGLTEKQAERAAAVQAEKFEKEVRDSMTGISGTFDNPNITFREFAFQWLERIKQDHSLSYYENSKDIIDDVIQYIGGFKLRDLTPAIIQNFFNSLDKRKRIKQQITAKPDFREILASHGFDYSKLRFEYHIQSCTLSHAFNGKPVGLTWSKSLCQTIGIPFEELFDMTVTETPYKYETIHKYKATVRAILSLAKKNRLVEDNYATADYIDFPKKPSSKIVCMDDEQAKAYYLTLMHYPDPRIKTAMLIFLLTGFRRGEVAGLEWGDIDFAHSTITINRSITTVKRHGSIEKEPKTEGSKRTITIAQILLQVIKEYKIWWDLRKEAYGDYFAETNKVFTQDNGKNINPSTLYIWHKKILTTAHIEHFSLHSVRHTNITMQIAAGVPLVTVSARAGHARTSTTTDTYAHFIRSSDVVAADTINRIFSEAEEGIAPVTPSTDTRPKKSDTVRSFRKAKAEMEELGIETYAEYLEYLEFDHVRRMHELDAHSDDSEDD